MPFKYTLHLINILNECHVSADSMNCLRKTSFKMIPVKCERFKLVWTNLVWNGVVEFIEWLLFIPFYLMSGLRCKLATLNKLLFLLFCYSQRNISDSIGIIIGICEFRTDVNVPIKRSLFWKLRNKLWKLIHRIVVKTNLINDRRPNFFLLNKTNDQQRVHYYYQFEKKCK